MFFLKKFLFGAFIFVFWLSIYGCSVETDARQGGCLEDDDCKYGRICRDKICLESEELEHYESAENVAMKIFTSFQTQDFDAYVQVVPTPRDLTYGFDIGEVDYTDPRVNDYIDSRYNKLETDWIETSRIFDWEHAEWQGFEPGVLQPIAEGDNLALMSLNQLVGSEIRLLIDNEEVIVTLARLVRLQGYWRIFAIIEPPYTVGVDLL